MKLSAGVGLIGASLDGKTEAPREDLKVV